MGRWFQALGWFFLGALCANQNPFAGEPPLPLAEKKLLWQAPRAVVNAGKGIKIGQGFFLLDERYGHKCRLHRSPLQWLAYGEEVALALPVNSETGKVLDVAVHNRFKSIGSIYDKPRPRHCNRYQRLFYGSE